MCHVAMILIAQCQDFECFRIDLLDLVGFVGIGGRRQRHRHRDLPSLPEKRRRSGLDRRQNDSRDARQELGGIQHSI